MTGGTCRVTIVVYGRQGVSQLHRQGLRQLRGGNEISNAGAGWLGGYDKFIEYQLQGVYANYRTVRAQWQGIELQLLREYVYSVYLLVFFNACRRYNHAMAMVTRNPLPSNKH